MRKEPEQMQGAVVFRAPSRDAPLQSMKAVLAVSTAVGGTLSRVVSATKRAGCAVGGRVGGQGGPSGALAR